MSAAEELDRIAARLREVGEKLDATDLADQEAEALAREAAELAAEGGGVIDRALSELSERDGSESGH